jgi:hypothetical protein
MRYAVSRPLSILLVLVLALPPAMAQAQDYHLTGTFGLDYSNGNYGTDHNTDVLLGLSTLSLQMENLKFAASVPYMRISGRGLLVFDAAGNPTVINRRSNIAPDVRTGFGDVNLSATYSIPPAILDNFDVRATARIKLPTASERRRLSTGKADYGFNLDVSHPYGAWTPFITAGYLIAGQPATFDLRDTISLSAGTSVELSDNLVAVVSYDRDSASSPRLTSSQEMFGSLSWIINDKVTMTGYGTAGLSNGSPGVGGGLLLSYALN